MRIQKVMNARLYDKYMTAVADLEGLYREPGCEPIHEVLRHLRVHPASLPTGRVDINELIAFHGATPDIIDMICKAGGQVLGEACFVCWDMLFHVAWRVRWVPCSLGERLTSVRLSIQC